MSKPANTKSATKPAASKGGAKGQPSKATKLGWLSLFIGIALASAFFASTSLLLVVGMLPTLVAFATDRSRGKYAAISMSVLNFAGVLPFVVNLWRAGEGLGAAVHALTQPFTWFVMYGAAGIGFAIFHYLPKFIATYVAFRAQGQLGTLQGLQKKLLEKWGPSVAHNDARDSAATNAGGRP